MEQCGAASGEARDSAPLSAAELVASCLTDSGAM
jgi:hypothetical protein